MHRNIVLEVIATTPKFMDKNKVKNTGVRAEWKAKKYDDDEDDVVEKI